jgi:hypothetical protein
VVRAIDAHALGDHLVHDVDGADELAARLHRFEK